MNFKTISTKTYLFWCLLLLPLMACGTPDFKAAQTPETDANTSVQDATNDVQPTDPHTPDDVGTFDDTSLADTSLADTSLADTSPPSIPPTVTITSAPDAVTNHTSATFEFACNQDNCTFECSMNGPFANCTSPITYDNLSDNQHTFIVRAQSPHGDTSPDVNHVWTVDTIAPSIINLTGPPTHTNLKTAEIAFECDEPDCTFECALNVNDFGPCTAPIRYENLPDGQHTVTVRATDLAQNISEPATISWTIDTVPPTVTILTGPDDTTYFSSATFTFECNKPGCKFQCSIDNNTTLQDCSSPKTYKNLSRKAQSFTVQATDRAGNTTLSTPYKWTVTWPKWVQVGVGAQHACGRLDDGTIWCWGTPDSNTLGHPTILNSPAPIQVESASDWQYIAAGGTTSCGIRNGRLYCWGYTSGGDPEPNSVLQRYTGTNWKSVALGNGWHYCGIRAPQQLWCWGLNSQGQLGIGSTSKHNDPVQVSYAHKWHQVSVGQFHTCGLATVADNEYGYCWGHNEHNQIPNRDASITRVLSPYQVHTMMNISDNVWAVGNHTFAERVSSAPSSPVAYGENSHGQLGLGHYSSPVDNGPAVNPRWLTNLTGGNSFSCGRLDHTVYCAGKNHVGQLGRGYTSPDENTFRTIQAPGVKFTQVDASSLIVLDTTASACALDTDNNIWCWGSITNSPTPTKVPWPH